jgi:hypothetical protein
MARRAHSRSGTYVEGFERNGSWVSGHYRSGTNVSESSRLTERQIAENIRRIDDYFTPLVFETKCFWCSSLVFFYRSKDGGCALFDRLGRPWKLHGCWKEYRESVKRRIANELFRHQFNGTYYYKERQRASKPPKSDSIAMSGFVDRSRRERISLPSYRGATSGVFHLVNFVPDDKIDMFYSVLIPASVVDDFSTYSMHDINCTFKKHRNRWFCILTSYRRLSAGGKGGQSTSGFVRIDEKCNVCGCKLDDGHWGFGTNFVAECSRCGKSRGAQSSEDFLEYICACYRQQRKRRPQ